MKSSIYIAISLGLLLSSCRVLTDYVRGIDTSPSLPWALPDNQDDSGWMDMTSNALLLHLNDSSGSVQFSDSSGNGNSAACANLHCPAFASSGRIDESQLFDGRDDLLEVADASILDTSSMTLGFWFKPSSVFSTSSDNRQTLFDKGVYSVFLDETDGKLKHSLANTGTPSWQTSYDTVALLATRLNTFKGKLYSGFSGGGIGEVHVCDPGTDGVCEPADWSVSLNLGRGSSSAMATFQGRLYAGIDWSPSDGDIYVCTPGADDVCDPGDWQVSFESPNTVVLTMTPYKGRLYMGTGGTPGEADIYVCNPGADEICNPADWTLAYDGTERRVTSLVVFGDYLYGSQHTSANTAGVFRCDPGADGACDLADWSMSFNGDGAHAYTQSLGVFQGKLYTGMGAGVGTGDIYACDPGADGICQHAEWTSSYDGPESRIFEFKAYQGKLYVTQGSTVPAGDILVCDPGADKTCDQADWQVFYDGPTAMMSALAVYNGVLYASIGISAGDGDIISYNAGQELSSTRTQWDSDWYHVAITNDGSAASMYINGTIQDTVSVPGAMKTNDSNLFIGRSIGAGAPSPSLEAYSGMIDEIAIFGAALSSGTVQNIYQKQKP